MRSIVPRIGKTSSGSRKYAGIICIYSRSRSSCATSIAESAGVFSSEWPMKSSKLNHSRSTIRLWRSACACLIAHLPLFRNFVLLFSLLLLHLRRHLLSLFISPSPPSFSSFWALNGAISEYSPVGFVDRSETRMSNVVFIYRAGMTLSILSSFLTIQIRVGRSCVH